MSSEDKVTRLRALQEEWNTLVAASGSADLRPVTVGRPEVLADREARLAALKAGLSGTPADAPGRAGAQPATHLAGSPIGGSQRSSNGVSGRGVLRGAMGRPAASSPAKVAIETPTWDGPTRPFTVTFEYEGGATYAHKSMAPHWRRAMALALSAAPAMMPAGAKVSTIRVEER